VTSPASRALVRCVRALAAFDLVVTGCLALPPFARVFLALALAPQAPPGSGPIAFGPLELLFVHLAGVLGVLWALARLRAPTPELALLDVGGRFAVAALILHATSSTGMTPLLHFFVATEIGGAFLQYWAVRRAQSLAAA
jgi:hypothetical protein